MCGIAGMLDRTLQPDHVGSIVRSMTGRLAHRGPDAEGIWVDPSDGVAFGHRRLSVIDLTDASNQPFVSADGRYVLTYNGEIYNFQEIRAVLVSAGAAFTTRGDTEVLLQAVITWGIAKALVKFNGMFAFALWDRKGKIAYLARDRFGEAAVRCCPRWLVGVRLRGPRASVRTELFPLPRSAGRERVLQAGVHSRATLNLMKESGSSLRARTSSLSTRLAGVDRSNSGRP